MLLEKVIDTPVSVLLKGELGVGKEYFAKYIHYHGSRSKNPFVALNIAARPPSLVDAEILGYERGAFTDAKGNKFGAFQRADKGTLFLDGIEDIPLAKQPIILEFLQSSQVLPLGSNKRVSVDVRIISSASSGLHRAVVNGLVREDLYYRLSVFPIVIPPLRERPEDILPLAESFIAELRNKLPPS
jgi:transcriptional regulator with GAF, ATPase, and Fis domain